MSGPACERCNDTGIIAVRSRDCSYVGPGPVPEYARGVAEGDCWDCNAARDAAADRVERYMAGRGGL